MSGLDEDIPEPVICFDDDVPEVGISLADAYIQIFNDLVPNLEALNAAIEAAELSLNEALYANSDVGLRIEAEERFDHAINSWQQAQQDAHRFFREKLSLGEIKAYIQDPISGELSHPNGLRAKLI
jgi:hypothetical protein